MFIGLLSGAIAAIVASLLSLPLHSPDDAFFNTASVTIGALLVGVSAAKALALTWDVHAAAYGQSALGLQPQAGLLL